MQRKGLFLLLLMLSVVLLFGGCSKGNEAKRNEISVSILPYKFIAEQLTGNKIKVNCMLSPGDNPSTYQPTPQQIAGLEKSYFYFKNGHLAFEKAWMPNIESNNKSLNIIDCSKGIALIEGHSHGEASHEGHSHGESCDHNEDPHYWTLPENAKLIAKNMYEALLTSELQASDSLEMHYQRFLLRIDALHDQVNKQLTDSKRKSFLIYHPALSYLANTYGLEQIPLEQEGKAPSVAQLKDLIDHASKHGLKTIFIQKQFDKDNASLLAKEINAKIVTIDPLAYDYIGSMQDLSNKLHQALNE